MALTVARGTNLVEYHESTALAALNDNLEVHADSSEFTFTASVTGGANFKLALEMAFNDDGTWFEIDTSKTINAAGQYIYCYTGKPANKIRMRISQVTSGTPNVIAGIGVCYHG